MDGWMDGWMCVCECVYVCMYVGLYICTFKLKMLNSTIKFAEYIYFMYIYSLYNCHDILRHHLGNRHYCHLS